MKQGLITNAPRSAITQSENSPIRTDGTSLLTLMLKEGPKSLSLLRKRDGVSRWSSFCKLPLLSSWAGVVTSTFSSSPFFSLRSTEWTVRLCRRPMSSGVTEVLLCGPSRGISGERRTGTGGSAAFWDAPMKLASLCSRGKKTGTTNAVLKEQDKQIPEGIFFYILYVGYKCNEKEKQNDLANVCAIFIQSWNTFEYSLSFILVKFLWQHSWRTLVYAPHICSCPTVLNVFFIHRLKNEIRLHQFLCTHHENNFINEMNDVLYV